MTWHGCHPRMGTGWDEFEVVAASCLHQAGPHGPANDARGVGGSGQQPYRVGVDEFGKGSF